MRLGGFLTEKARGGLPPAAAFSVKTREFSSSNLDFGGVPRTVTPVFYIDFPTPPLPTAPTAAKRAGRGERAINKTRAERVVEVTPPKKQRRKKLVKKKKTKGTMAKKSKKGQDNINRYVSSSRGGKPRALGWRVQRGFQQESPRSVCTDPRFRSFFCALSTVALRSS